MRVLIEPPSHREVLATGAAFPTANSADCTFWQRADEVATGVVYNEAADTKSVAVTVTDPDADQPRLETAVSLGRGERIKPTETDELPVIADYTVEIDVEDGPDETYHWSNVSLELASLHVILSCRSGFTSNSSRRVGDLLTSRFSLAGRK